MQAQLDTRSMSMMRQLRQLVVSDKLTIASGHRQSLSFSVIDWGQVTAIVIGANGTQFTIYARPDDVVIHDPSWKVFELVHGMSRRTFFLVPASSNRPVKLIFKRG